MSSFLFFFLSLSPLPLALTFPFNRLPHRRKLLSQLVAPLRVELHLRFVLSVLDLVLDDLVHEGRTVSRKEDGLLVHPEEEQPRLLDHLREPRVPLGRAEDLGGEGGEHDLEVAEATVPVVSGGGVGLRLTVDHEGTLAAGAEDLKGETKGERRKKERKKEGKKGGKEERGRKRGLDRHGWKGKERKIKGEEEEKKDLEEETEIKRLTSASSTLEHSAGSTPHSAIIAKNPFSGIFPWQ